ncbi:hypothetical protein PS684_06112 [Pseudomonas fluorescens]|nr:hypothetical protein PS684_06112 [Pseudomonas fluorescens]
MKPTNGGRTRRYGQNGAEYYEENVKVLLSGAFAVGHAARG